MKKRILGAVKVFFALIVDPPGWIPAWVLTGQLILAQHLLLTYAVRTQVDLARLEFALKVAQLEADVYKVVLGIWLGYKGIGALLGVLTAYLGPKQEPKG